MIPKTIYLYHSELQENINYSDKWFSFNPEYTIRICGYDACKTMMRNNLPSIFYQTFMKISNHEVKADFFKLCILYHYGGIMVDVDLEPLCSLNSFIGTADIVLCKAMEEDTTHKYSTKFIAFYSESNLLKELLYRFINNSLAGHNIFNAATWDLSKMIEQIIVHENIHRGGIYQLNKLTLQILEQQSGTFFYDACIIYNKKRIMNDRQTYFAEKET